MESWGRAIRCHFQGAFARLGATRAPWWLLAGLLLLARPGHAAPASDARGAAAGAHTWRWLATFTSSITYESDGNVWFIAPNGTICSGKPAAADSLAAGAIPTWTTYAPPAGFKPSSLVVTRERVLYCAGRWEQSSRSVVLRTPLRSPPQWTVLEVPCLGQLYDLDAQSDGTVWVTGERREVFHLVADHWVKELTPLPYHNFQLRIFDQGTGWIVAETRDLSAVYHRSGGQWSLAYRGSGAFLLVHAEPGLAYVLTSEGVLCVPPPGAGTPRLSPDFPPALRGTVALTRPGEGWLLRDGTLQHLRAGQWETVPLERSIQGVTELYAPGDGSLYGADPSHGELYVLSPAPERSGRDPFYFRLLRHATWSGAPRIFGVSVLEMQERDLLYLVNHEGRNPTLPLLFRRDSSAPYDITAWQPFANRLKNGGPDDVEGWAKTYDMACVTGDLNGDGLEDMVLVGLYLGCRAYRNVRDDHFVDWTAEAGIAGTRRDHSVGAGLLDADGDGDLDLYVSNYLVPDRLYLNDGAFHFVDATATAGLDTHDSSYMPACADLDGDGDTDVAVATWGRGLMLHENVTARDGAARFVTTRLLLDRPDPETTLGLSTEYLNSVAVADLDNDGLPELLATSQTGADHLFWNRGRMRFEEAPGFIAGGEPRPPSEGANFADFDDDGDLDLFVTGTPSGRFYENVGDHLLLRQSTLSFPNSNKPRTLGSAVVDFEGDGDLDLVVGADAGEALFYENQANDGRSIMLHLIGPPTNRSAVGARVSLYDAGASRESAPLLACRQVSGGSGYGSQDSRWVHFGGLVPGHSYRARVRMAGAREGEVDGLVAGARRTVRLEPGGQSLNAGFLGYPIEHFLRERWNRFWAASAVLLGLVGLAAVRRPLRRPRHPRWLPLAPLAPPFAAALLYFLLPLDPGPGLALVSLGGALALLTLFLVLLGMVMPRTASPDTLLTLSDTLRLFRHNEAPRRASRALQFTLGNIPAAPGPEWRRQFQADLQDYDAIVFPALRSLVQLTQDVGLGAAEWSRRLGQQRRWVQAEMHRALAVAPDALPPAGWPGACREMRAFIEGIDGWLGRLQEDVDRALRVELESTLAGYLESRRRRTATPIDLEFALAGSVWVRVLARDLVAVLDVLVENAESALATVQDRRMTLIARLEPGRVVQLRLSDNGPGVPPAVEEVLFQPGFSTSNQPGRGMGLYYARRLVERYGGRLRFERPAAGGSCFVVELEVVTTPEGSKP